MNSPSGENSCAETASGDDKVEASAGNRMNSLSSEMSGAEIASGDDKVVAPAGNRMNTPSSEMSGAEAASEHDKPAITSDSEADNKNLLEAVDGDTLDTRIRRPSLTYSEPGKEPGNIEDDPYYRYVRADPTDNLDLIVLEDAPRTKDQYYKNLFRADKGVLRKGHKAYDLTGDDKGRCLIIYDEEKRMKDVENLRSVFQALGLVVEPVEMRENDKVEKFIREDMEKYEGKEYKVSVIVLLIQKGNQYALRAATDKSGGTRMSDLYKLLSHKKGAFEKMKNRPRVLIADYSELLQVSPMDMQKLIPKIDTGEPQHKAEKDGEWKFCFEDLFIWTYCSYGKSSETHGSRFIRAVCETFWKHSHHMHLGEMAEHIKVKLSNYKLKLLDGKELDEAMEDKEDEHIKWQLPLQFCTFTDKRKLFFFPEATDEFEQEARNKMEQKRRRSSLEYSDEDQEDYIKEVDITTGRGLMDSEWKTQLSKSVKYCEEIYQELGKGEAKDQVYDLFVKPSKDIKEIKGICIIINNHEGREGSPFDVDNARIVFQRLGFEVDIGEPVTEKEGFEKILTRRVKAVEKAVEEGQKVYKAFVLILMSHGTEGTLTDFKSSEDNAVHLDKLYRLISNSVFKSMAGKPKLVLVQACSGGSICEAPDDDDQTTGEVGYPQEESGEGADDSTMLKLQYEDVCVWLASFPAYKADRLKYGPRDPVTKKILIERAGARFIRAVVETLYKHAGQMNSEEIFEHVQDKMLVYSKKKLDDSLLSNKGKRKKGQMPIQINLFSNKKKLFFFPGQEYYTIDKKGNIRLKQSSHQPTD